MNSTPTSMELEMDLTEHLSEWISELDVDFSSPLSALTVPRSLNIVGVGAPGVILDPCGSNSASNINSFTSTSTSATTSQQQKSESDGTQSPGSLSPPYSPTLYNSQDADESDEQLFLLKELQSQYLLDDLDLQLDWSAPAPIDIDTDGDLLSTLVLTNPSADHEPSMELSDNNDTIHDPQFLNSLPETEENIHFYLQSTEPLTPEHESNLSSPALPDSDEDELNRVTVYPDFSSQFDSILKTIPISFSEPIEIEIDMDLEMETSERVIDSLMVGDLSGAESSVGHLLTGRPASYTRTVVKPITSAPVTLVLVSEGSIKTETSVASVSTQKKTATSSSGAAGSSRGGAKKPRAPKKSKIEKVLRKKEQNKTAATRYREKKKLQAAIVLTEESQLANVNQELTTQKTDLQKEISIIKSCLRALITANKKVDKKGIRSNKK